MSARLAVVTASAAGIGLASAKALAAAGWRVVMSDIDSARGAAEAKAIGAEFRPCDLRRPDDIAALFEGLGRVHALVNNGGIAGPTASVAHIALADWREVIDVNITAMFLACQQVIPAMVAAGEGVIVNMGSVAGLIGYPDRAPYATTKWAVRGFTATLAQELGPSGVRANAVLPASVRGDRIMRVIAAFAEAHGLAPAEAERAYLARQAQARLIEPDEVARTIVFLASDEARSITGQSIQVCGGFQ